MKKTTFILITSSVLFSFCKKQEGPQGPQGSAGPSLSGTLVGYVDVYDSYGALQKSDSVTINVTGKSISAPTDTMGKFVISNLTTGTYELVISKPTYQDTKIPSLNFVGGGTQYLTNRIGITQTPAFTLSNLSFSNIFGTISYTVTASTSDSKARKAIIFLSKNSNVSNNPSSYASTIIANIGAGSTNAIGTISSSNMTQWGFNSGDVIYAIAYPISNANNASIYFDTNSGKIAYNNLNLSGATVISNFIVP